MPEYYHYSLKAVPGVEQASPFIYYTVERQVGGQSRHFSIIGYDVFGGLGGPQKIYAGRNIEQAHYEMVADAKLGVRLGDKVPLGLHTYTVVGLTRGALDTNGDPLVYLSLPDAQEVLFQKDNEEVRNQRQRSLRTLSGQSYLSPALSEKLLPKLQPDTHIINAILVRLKPGADRAAVARHIENWLYFSAFTTQEEVELMLKGRLAGMTKQLLLFRTLLSHHLGRHHFPGDLYLYHGKDPQHRGDEAHRRPQPGHRAPGDGTIPAVDHQRLFIRPGPDPEHVSALSQDHLAGARR